MIPISEIERVIQNIINYKSAYPAPIIQAETANACNFAIVQLKELIPSETDNPGNTSKPE